MDHKIMASIHFKFFQELGKFQAHHSEISLMSMHMKQLQQQLEEEA